MFHQTDILLSRRTLSPCSDVLDDDNTAAEWSVGFSPTSLIADALYTCGSHPLWVGGGLRIHARYPLHVVKGGSKGKMRVGEPQWRH